MLMQTNMRETILLDEIWFDRTVCDNTLFDKIWFDELVFDKVLFEDNASSMLFFVDNILFDEIL